MKKRLLRGWLGALVASTLFSTIVAFPACLAQQGEEIGVATAMSEYYVAPNGNDLAEGTKEKPFVIVTGGESR